MEFLTNKNDWFFVLWWVNWLLLIDLYMVQNSVASKIKKKMEINWEVVGWSIDMILNGFIWLIIAVLSLLLIDATDKWTRKAIKFMDKADKWIRKLTEHSFDWVEKKNLQIPASIILLIIFGTLSQLGIIPKLIT